MQKTKIKTTKLNTNIAFCEEIRKLDLSKIKHKLLMDRSLNWGKTKIDIVEREYKKFLSIIKLYPNEIIVPNKLVDEFWHMHILDTKAYRENCDSIFGRFLDHYPYFGIHDEDDAQNLETAFQKTLSKYNKHYTSEITNDSSSRCSGHACHAPSSCACRTPGSCK